MIGIDEAGRGAVLGPLVVGAVQVADEQLFLDMGVRDSKQLSRKRRVIIDTKIRACSKVSLTSVSAKEIDTFRQQVSLNIIEERLFIQALTRLPCKGEVVYIDSFDTVEGRIGDKVSSKVGGVTVFSKHKADENYPCVAAASIVAKVARDAAITNIDELAVRTWGLHIGSGYPSDPTTCAFLRHIADKGEKFPGFVRQSWKTVQRLSQLTLDAYNK